MAPATHERRMLPGFGGVVAIILGLPLLYALSVGPAWVLYGRGYISKSAHANAYLPLWWLYQRSDTVGDVIDWYLDRWHTWDSPYDQPPLGRPIPVIPDGYPLHTGLRGRT